MKNRNDVWVKTCIADDPALRANRLSLLYAICYTLLMYVIAYGMYRRGWFLRI